MLLFVADFSLCFMEKGKLYDVLLTDMKDLDLHIYFDYCAVYKRVHTIAMFLSIPSFCILTNDLDP